MMNLPSLLFTFCLTSQSHVRALEVTNDDSATYERKGEDFCID